MKNNQQVARYYDFTTPFYRWFWHGSTGATHYGFADEATKGLRDELLNTNRFLAERAGVKAGDRILDAGCGVAGSAIWLTDNFDVSVVGITLSRRQVTEAKKSIGDREISIKLQDYTKTGFPDASFDVIWAIESVCHTPNKDDFLKEAHRLLKKGGRLIVADGVLLRNPKSGKEKLWYSQFIKGLVLPNLASMKGFKQSMKSTGFKNLRSWNKTTNTLPSSKRLYRMCKIGYPIATVLEKIGITPKLLTANNLAGIAQYKMVKNGLAGYGVFYGEKA